VIRPYVADDVEGLDLSVPEVTTIEAARTFWDKIIGNPKSIHLKKSNNYSALSGPITDHISILSGASAITDSAHFISAESGTV
jgi:hypothetical protein